MCLVGSGLDDNIPSPYNVQPSLNIARSFRLQPIYYSRKYLNTLFNMSNNERIVMRSDRLPTSDLYQQFGANTMGGMANGHFQLYEIPIEGVVTSGETQPPLPTFQIQEPEPIESGDTPNKIAEILATFSCGSLVTLFKPKNPALPGRVFCCPDQERKIRLWIR